MENETRGERQAAGIRAAKERGVYLGRQPGFRKSKPHRALQLREKGLTAPEIAQAIGVSVRTVYRYLGEENVA
jgi:DNA invertase Pin-like site-specific DNA recombinase